MTDNNFDRFHRDLPADLPTGRSPKTVRTGFGTFSTTAIPFAHWAP